MPPEHSAGILLHRRSPAGGREVLIGHLGGPFWARRQEGAWSLPKGLIEADETPIAAARREFAEELGILAPEVDYELLGEFRYRSGKLLTVFAAEADLDLSAFRPGTFELTLRGRAVSFPELDEARWVPFAEARPLLVAGQRAALDAVSTRP